MEKNDRIRANSSTSSNIKIDQQINSSIQSARAWSLEELTIRINNLEKEYDIERILELNASTLAFIGVLLGAFINTYWLILPGIVLPFLAFHAVQGWCPPLPVLRYLKIRSQKEIDSEIFALKIIRGDFDALQMEKSSDQILKAIRK